MAMLNETLHSLEHDNKYYKKFRNKQVDNSSVSINDNWDVEEVIEKIDEQRLNNGQSSFFEDIINHLVENKHISTLANIYCTAFANLDFLGYKKDKLDKSPRNFNYDSIHSYYSFSSCDYLITQDDSLRFKTKVLNHSLGGKCQVLNSDELINKFK